VNAKLKRLYAELALQNAAIDVLPGHRLRAGTSKDDTEHLLMRHHAPKLPGRETPCERTDPVTPWT